MKKPSIRKKQGAVLFLLTLVLSLLGLLGYVFADPTGPILVSNSTLSPSGTGLMRNDSGGTITVVVFSANQNNPSWKAYVGNISGALVLDDSSGYSIYNWEMTTVVGEVYATRASTVTWSTVACADDAFVTTEQGNMGMGASDTDNLNKTFNYTKHDAFWVSNNNISNSSCRTTYTFVNDSRQSDNETSYFQEVLLNSSTNIIYSTIIENNQLGFSENATYDFQMLVAENDQAAGNDAYYFWVELG